MDMLPVDRDQAEHLGELAFSIGEPDGSVRRVVAGPGDVVWMAGVTPHTIRKEGHEDAVAFGVHSPAAVMEAFTRAVVAMAAESPGAPPSMADVLAVAERHGVELLGPVPVPA
jgi:hypothetical protein